ncbi:MAG: putative selenium-dependent hydroxylase accessory protein YqeC [Acidobacteria bacterium]|nr:MAG: putative selenium-dependent hydroxylase accessory protein YqeC [Acidobacteriota bacterium]
MRDFQNKLVHFLGLEQHRTVYVIGAGGKTSFINMCAARLTAAGKSVLCTTSTRIMLPNCIEKANVLIESDIRTLCARIQARHKRPLHLTLGKKTVDKNQKIKGFGPAELDFLSGENLADVLLIEADGAAGRPLKVHGSHEPVLSEDAPIICWLIGVDSVGLPFTAEHVHRFSLAREWLQKEEGTPLLERDVADLFFHQQSALHRLPKRAELVVLINKVHTGRNRKSAVKLASLLQSRDQRNRIDRIAHSCLKDANILTDPMFDILFTSNRK